MINLSALGIPAIWQAAPVTTPISEAQLIVVLHGRGDSPEGFTWFQSALNIPNLNFLLLQAPDDYYGGYSWYGMAPDQLPGILRSRELLTQVFKELGRQGFSMDRCMLFGFSQGCLMTLEFGGRFSEKLAGYIGISGYVYDADQLVKDVNPKVMKGNWLVTHGTQDDVLPVQATRDQIQRLIEGGFKIEYLEYSKVHTIDEKLELPMIREWILAHLKK